VGTIQNRVSIKSADGTIGDSEISTIIVDIGTNLGYELQGLVNTDNVPLIYLTALMIPI
jgi:hypothetical protein